MDTSDEALDDLFCGEWKAATRPIFILDSDRYDKYLLISNVGGKSVNRLEIRLEPGTSAYSTFKTFADAYTDLAFYTTSESAYIRAADLWPADHISKIHRLMFKGDCQAQHASGTENEQEIAESALEHCDENTKTIAVVSILGTDVLFGECNFKVSDDPFFMPLKVVRVSSEWRNLVIPQMVARFGLQSIVCIDQHSWETLSKQFAGTPYQSLLERKIDQDANRNARRQAIRAVGSGVEGPAPSQTGKLFRGWLSPFREAAPKQGVTAAQRAGAKQAIELFFSLRNATLVPADAEIKAFRLIPELSEGIRDYAVAAHSLCRLARSDEGAFEDTVQLLERLGSGHLCRPELVERLIDRWATDRRPSTWMRLLTKEDDASVLERIARDSDVYLWARSQFREDPVSPFCSLLVFDTWQEEVDFGTRARRALRSARQALTDDKPSDFDLALEGDANIIPLSELRTLRLLAKEAWGPARALHWQLGYVIADREKRYKDALDDCRKWVELTNNEHRPWTELGHALIFVDDDKGAEEAYRRSIEIREYNPSAWLGLAKALYWQNRDEEACKAAKTAYDQFPGSFEAQWYGRTLYIANESELWPFLVRLEDGDLKGCLARYYLEALAKDPALGDFKARFADLFRRMDVSDHRRTIQFCSWDLADTNRAQIAIDLFTPYIEDDGDYAAAASALMFAYVRAGKSQEALAFYAANPVLCAEPRSLLRVARIHLYGRPRDIEAARRYATNVMTFPQLPPNGEFTGLLLDVAGDRKDELWNTYSARHHHTPEGVNALLIMSIKLERRDSFAKAVADNAELPDGLYKCFNTAIIALSSGSLDMARSVVKDAWKYLRDYLPERRESILDELEADLMLSWGNGRLAEVPAFFAAIRDDLRDLQT